MSEHICQNCGRPGATEMAQGTMFVAHVGVAVRPPIVHSWAHKSCLAVANELIWKLQRELAEARQERTQ